MGAREWEAPPGPGPTNTFTRWVAPRTSYIYACARVRVRKSTPGYRPIFVPDLLRSWWPGTGRECVIHAACLSL